MRKRPPYSASSLVESFISEPTVRQWRYKIRNECKQTHSRKSYEIYLSYFVQSIKFQFLKIMFDFNVTHYGMDGISFIPDRRKDYSL
jgi:hypothetical protein